MAGSSLLVIVTVHHMVRGAVHLPRSERGGFPRDHRRRSLTQQEGGRARRAGFDNFFGVTVHNQSVLCRLAATGLLDASFHSCDEAGMIFEHAGNSLSAVARRLCHWQIASGKNHYVVGAPGKEPDRQDQQH
jgi:hypothetical protein